MKGEKSMWYVLFGIAAIITALIWSWLAVVYVIIFIAYNVIRLLYRCMVEGTVLSAMLINGPLIAIGIAALSWAFS